MTRREKLWIIVSETKDKRRSRNTRPIWTRTFLRIELNIFYWSIFKKNCKFSRKRGNRLYGGWTIYFFFVFICDSFQWLLFSKNNCLNERFSYQFYIVRSLQFDDIGRFRCCSNHDPNKSRFNSRNRGRHEQI